MRYTRKYNVAYICKMKADDNHRLNSILDTNGVYMAESYDSQIIQNTQGLQTEINEETTYGIDVNGIENGLTFDYNTDARHTQKQLMSIFPDGGLFPINKITEATEETRLKSIRGPNVILSKWNEEEEVVEIDNTLHEGYDFMLKEYTLEDDVKVRVKLEIGYNAVLLQFDILWDANRVARKDVIEKRLVNIPLELMAYIQHKIEQSLVTNFNKDIIKDPTITCKFESINFTESECAPDIIDMVRKAKEELILANMLLDRQREEEE